MPVVKSQAARPLIKDALVLDLSDVAQQAARIKEDALLKAKQIIDKAKTEAQAVSQTTTQRAYEEGKTAGYEAGHKKGYDEGVEKGYEEAFEKTRETLAALEQPWIESAKQWDQYRTDVDEQTREAVLELSLRLADKIIQRTIELDPSIVADQLTIALRQVTGVTAIQVHICPDDRPLLEEVMPTLLRKFAEFEHIELVEDANIGRGGCIVKHESGSVDVSIETQLRRVVELLLPSESTSPQAEAPPESVEAEHPPPVVDQQIDPPAETQESPEPEEPPSDDAQPDEITEDKPDNT